MEDWRKIKDYEEYYEISRLGEIRNIKTGKIIPFKKHSKGYVNVNLFVDGKQSVKLVHRLLALAFIPNPENLSQVNHINGIKNDNRIENLEWISASGNMKHAFKIGLNKHNEFQKEALRKRVSKKVIDIITGEIFDSVIIASEKYSIPKSTLGGMLRGEYKNITNLKYL